MTTPIDPDHTRAVAEKDRDLYKAHAEELADRNAELAGRVAELEAERGQQQAEINRLWHFIDTNDRLHDVITGRPDHYIVNGDHSGCDCGTDWTPPPVRVEWTAGHPYEDGRPGLCTHGNQGEHNARQMGSRDGWTVQRRLVGPWRDADPAPEADDRQREGT